MAFDQKKAAAHKGAVTEAHLLSFGVTQAEIDAMKAIQINGAPVPLATWLQLLIQFGPTLLQLLQALIGGGIIPTPAPVVTP